MKQSHPFREALQEIRIPGMQAENKELTSIKNQAFCDKKPSLKTYGRFIFNAYDPVFNCRKGFPRCESLPKK